METILGSKKTIKIVAIVITAIVVSIIVILILFALCFRSNETKSQIKKGVRRLHRENLTPALEITTTSTSEEGSVDTLGTQISAAEFSNERMSANVGIVINNPPQYDISQSPEPPNYHQVPENDDQPCPSYEDVIVHSELYHKATY